MAEQFQILTAVNQYQQLQQNVECDRSKTNQLTDHINQLQIQKEILIDCLNGQKHKVVQSKSQTQALSQVCSKQRTYISSKQIQLYQLLLQNSTKQMQYNTKIISQDKRIAELLQNCKKTQLQLNQANQKIQQLALSLIQANKKCCKQSTFIQELQASNKKFEDELKNNQLMQIEVQKRLESKLIQKQVLLEELVQQRYCLREQINNTKKISQQLYETQHYLKQTINILKEQIENKKSLNKLFEDKDNQISMYRAQIKEIRQQKDKIEKRHQAQLQQCKNGANLLAAKFQNLQMLYRQTIQSNKQLKTHLNNKQSAQLEFISLLDQIQQLNNIVENKNSQRQLEMKLLRSKIQEYEVKIGKLNQNQLPNQTGQTKPHRFLCSRILKDLKIYYQLIKASLQRQLDENRPNIDLLLDEEHQLLLRIIKDDYLGWKVIA